MISPQPRTYRYSIFIIRLVIWLIPVVLLLWVINQNLVAFGSVTYRCTANGCDRKVKNFASKEPEKLVGTTKENGGDQYRLITVDPFYFDIKTFRETQRATVRLTYQFTDGQGRLRLGVITKGSKAEFYDFADQSTQFAELEQEWHQVREGDITLFTRPGTGLRLYSSIEDFLRDPPAKSSTAIYNLDPTGLIRLPSYISIPDKRKYVFDIRGTHLLYVYVGKDEPLNLQFSVQDINRHEGKDDVVVDVFQGSKVIQNVALRDDGDTKRSGIPSPERSFDVTIPNLSEGVYGIRVSANDDAFIRSLTTSHRLIVFDKKLYLAGSKEYEILGGMSNDPITLYVRGTFLSVLTSHKNSLQTITVGSRKITLTKTLRKVTIQLPRGRDFVPVTVPIRDVVLETDGTFVFSRDQHFDGNSPIATTLRSGDDISGYDYVLASYPRVSQEGRWFIAKKNLDLVPAGRNLHFLIVGDPSLGESKASVRMKELSIRLEGSALSPKKIRHYISTLFKRARSGGE